MLQTNAPQAQFIPSIGVCDGREALEVRLKPQEVSQVTRAG